MNDELDQLTDAQLSEVFAVEVTGWRSYYPIERVQAWRLPDGCAVMPPEFATSVDAVLPYIEAYTRLTDERNGGEPIVFRIYSPAGPEDVWTVEPWWLHHDGPVQFGPGAQAKTQAAALCKALIREYRQNKQSVEFSP